MKLKFIFFIICLALLLVFQAKVVMPLVYDIIASDFFLEDSGDKSSRISTENDMTNFAYKQCNAHIANDILTGYNLVFTDHPINAFGLGNFQYVINADIEIQPVDGAAFNKRYVCRIKYLEGDDVAGLPESSNWSIDGLSGLDNI